ncbi:N-acetyltransferase [Bacillus sp. MRMR6]|uniref:GNAT family N-acetyltransferase n=1 Tax=Bacillus sp. MRMR6 TaxID=1928617 RepID=UPI000950F0FF|nr:GNAT family N-acetyltransferase [Bacillus sp. MRMR6]OLS41101.1 GNAT family N-acetyltransferase [Bacillus sp. MRMR6]
MSDIDTRNGVTFYKLEWDTEFFGVKCAKAILHKPLTLDVWTELKLLFKEYQFISIENQNSDPINAQLIGKDTPAFLADINIQFVKYLEEKDEQHLFNNITLHHSLKRNDKIVEMADFQFSKFTADIELANRGGERVYSQWLINSFDKPNKYFALSKDENEEINGFLLYSYSDDACVIELIAVSQRVPKSGVGTSLFNTVEHSAIKNGSKIIKVGTQVRNLGAVNFYHKVGCRQVGCHQIYHLWNL